MRRSFRQSHGNARLVAVAALAAAGLGAKFAWDMYQSGARDPSYIIFMALAAVVALAIVAPRWFRGASDAEGQWGGEDGATRTLPETPMPADSDPSINRAKKDSEDGR
jgi:hypothetical protein